VKYIQDQIISQKKYKVRSYAGILTVHPLLIAGGFTMDYRFTASFPHCYIIQGTAASGTKYDFCFALGDYLWTQDTTNCIIHLFFTQDTECIPAAGMNPCTVGQNRVLKESTGMGGNH
jgi:hypothetical protein